MCLINSSELKGGVSWGRFCGISDFQINGGSAFLEGVNKESMSNRANKRTILATKCLLRPLFSVQLKEGKFVLTLWTILFD
jgi:hypothetical protein